MGTLTPGAVWFLLLVAWGGRGVPSETEAAPPTEVATVNSPETNRDHDLRAEAKSTRHLLRRKSFNKYYEACQKSNVAERKHMAGSYT